MRPTTFSLAATFVLLISQGVLANDWIDYGESDVDVVPSFDDDSEQYLSALTRDDEQEIHSPFITGFKYVSGGAGEGRQHLSPNGDIPNRPEVKTDEELPSYCDPPNPCPLGSEADDCDDAPMAAFTAKYSQLYQTRQNCRCDNDHDKCALDASLPSDNLKRSRRTRRDTRRKQTKNGTGHARPHNPYHKGQNLYFHVAKKSPHALSA